MFRSIVNTSRIVSRRPAIVCYYSNQVQRLVKRSTLSDAVGDYFHKSPKYKTFQPADKNLYEFDAESRRLAPSNILANAKSISWTNLPANCTNADLILTLKNVGDYCQETKTSLSSEQFDAFVDELVKRLPTFTANETICALQIFARIPMEIRPLETRNFAELIIGLDQATTINAAQWDIDQVLFTGSVWITIPSAKKTFYARFLGRHLNKCAKLMTIEQIAQAMCYLNTMKRPMDNVRSFENIFDEKIEAMTALELSIVCRNFVRLDMSLAKPELHKKLLNYVLAHDLDELNDLLLFNILYVIQKSSRKHDVAQVAALQKKLQKTMDQRSLQTCVVIADLGSFLQFVNAEIFEYTLQRCMSESNALASFRNSELEQLSRMIGMLNFTSESDIDIVVGKAILQELRNRVDQIVNQKFHQQLIKIQANLTMKDIYDLEMLQNTLRTDYIRFIYRGAKKLPANIYTLDAYARINLANTYKGETLPDTHLQKLGKFLTNYFPGDAPDGKFPQQDMADTAKCVQNLFKHFTYAHAISHFRCADIFVGIDKTTGEGVDVSHLFPPPYTGKIFSAQSIIGDTPNLEIYAFVCASFGMFSVDTEQMMGAIKQKLQQLQLLGFNTVLIPGPEWHRLEVDERTDFVHQQFLKKFQEVRLNENKQLDRTERDQ